MEHDMFPKFVFTFVAGTILGSLMAIGICWDLLGSDNRKPEVAAPVAVSAGAPGDMLTGDAAAATIICTQQGKRMSGYKREDWSSLDKEINYDITCK